MVPSLTALSFSGLRFAVVAASLTLPFFLHAASRAQCPAKVTALIRRLDYVPFGSFSTDPTSLACRFLSASPRKQKPNHQVELVAMRQEQTHAPAFTAPVA